MCMFAITVRHWSMSSCCRTALVKYSSLISHPKIHTHAVIHIAAVIHISNNKHSPGQKPEQHKHPVVRLWALAPCCEVYKVDIASAWICIWGSIQYFINSYSLKIQKILKLVCFYMWLGFYINILNIEGSAPLLNGRQCCQKKKKVIA